MTDRGQIVAEGEVTFRVEKRDHEENPYRAKLPPHGEWYSAETVDGAVHKAASRATEGLVEEALGPLWGVSD